MKLTAKAHYAVTAMLDVAINASDKKPISLSSIARRQHISLSYLEQLFANLRKKSLVTSVRGPGGGYFIQNQLDLISIANIVEAVNEFTEVMACGGNKKCKNGNQCLSHNLWFDLNSHIQSFLEKRNLKDLVEQVKNKTACSKKRKGKLS